MYIDMYFFISNQDQSCYYRLDDTNFALLAIASKISIEKKSNENGDVV